jgi:hypothetical protein
VGKTVLSIVQIGGTSAATAVGGPLAGAAFQVASTAAFKELGLLKSPSPPTTREMAMVPRPTRPGECRVVPAGTPRPTDWGAEEADGEIMTAANNLPGKPRVEPDRDGRRYGPAR